MLRKKFPCHDVTMSVWAHVHDDVINWKHFPRYWPFVRGIHWSPMNSPHKGLLRGALMFSFICAWINDRVNNREAGDLRRHRAHYEVIVMDWHHWCHWWEVWWEVKIVCSGPWFNTKMSSYQYRKSHCGDKTILRPSYLHNGISYTGKTTSLHWIRALEVIIPVLFMRVFTVGTW